MSEVNRSTTSFLFLEQFLLMVNLFKKELIWDIINNVQVIKLVLKLIFIAIFCLHYSL